MFIHIENDKVGQLCHFVYIIIRKEKIYLKSPESRGTWVAQSVESDFGSGHDLVVPEFEPRIRLCADSSEPGACFRFCVPLPLCPSPARTLSLSLKNKYTLKKNKAWICIRELHQAMPMDVGGVLVGEEAGIVTTKADWWGPGSGGQWLKLSVEVDQEARWIIRYQETVRRSRSKPDKKLRSIYSSN